jgi:hypothetical protein
MCKARVNNVNTVESDSDEDNDEFLYIGCVDTVNAMHKERADQEWVETLTVSGKDCRVQLDTGAMCNVMSI